MVAKPGKNVQEQRRKGVVGKSTKTQASQGAENPITAAKRPRRAGLLKLGPGKTRLRKAAAKEEDGLPMVRDMALTPSKPNQAVQPVTRAIKRKLLSLECTSEKHPLLRTDKPGKRVKRKQDPKAEVDSLNETAQRSEAQIPPGPQGQTIARAETPEHREETSQAKGGTFLKQLLLPVYSLFRGEKNRESSSTSSLDTSPVERKRAGPSSRTLRSESPEDLPDCEVNTLPVSERERHQSRHGTPEIVVHENEANQAAELDSNDEEETSIKFLQDQLASREANLASDETKRTDADEEEEGDEYLDDDYDPYLFIKILPPLETRVAPWRRCLLPKQKQHRKTLVLDLDETLVHTELRDECTPEAWFKMMIGGQMKFVCVGKRPHLDHFLERCAALYEVVVFTASLKHYADAVIDRIDPQRKYVQHRLFRDSCLQMYGNYMKDLSALGRDLSQTIIVDNSPQAYGYQLANGIPIESWYDNPKDDELLKMLKVLEALAKAPDVRPIIKETFESHKLVEAANYPDSSEAYASLLADDVE